MPASSSAMSTRIWDMESLTVGKFSGHIVGNLTQFRDAIWLGDDPMDPACPRLDGVDCRPPAGDQHETRVWTAPKHRVRDLPAVSTRTQAEIGDHQVKLWRCLENGDGFFARARHHRSMPVLLEHHRGHAR